MASLNKEQFGEKIKNLYLSKKKERISIIGSEENNGLEKKIFLQIIDFAWRSHLQYLEQLRQVIGLRSYGQKDPLSEFKKEAFTLFEGLLEKIKNDVIKFLLNLNIVVSNEEERKEKSTEISSDNKKVGRNEKCPCGSGKKYKHCCGSV
jgi:preprotein translocase subunit SecA